MMEMENGSLQDEFSLQRAIFHFQDCWQRSNILSIPKCSGKLRAVNRGLGHIYGFLSIITSRFNGRNSKKLFKTCFLERMFQNRCLKSPFQKISFSVEEILDYSRFRLPLGWFPGDHSRNSNLDLRVSGDSFRTSGLGRSIQILNEHVFQATESFISSHGKRNGFSCFNSDTIFSSLTLPVTCSFQVTHAAQVHCCQIRIVLTKKSPTKMLEQAHGHLTTDLFFKYFKDD